MPRLARLSAGSDVVVRARRLSDELLGHEQALFDRIERTFVDQVDAAAVVVARALRSNLSAAARTDLVGGTSLLLLDAVYDQRPMVDAMLSQTLTMAVDSVRDELRLCGRTLTSKYRFVADLAADAADAQVDVYVKAAVQSWHERMIETVGWFTEVLDQEARAEAVSKGSHVLADRVLSTERVVAAGHAGRGLWWQVFSRDTAAVRAVEFAAVNGVRNRAMTEFNRKYEAVV